MARESSMAMQFDNKSNVAGASCDIWMGLGVDGQWMSCYSFVI